MWFKKLVGFEETSPEQVRKNLVVSGETITSKINGATYRCGRLEIPTLHELRKNSSNLTSYQSQIQVSEIVSDVQLLHVANENAMIQAASQFNLLEMVHPSVTPERGVDIYENDFTQGPACAIACGAGTIYRNYFVEIDNQIGQSEDTQIDCLSELAAYFNNSEMRHWKMQNGYALISQEGLEAINQKLTSLNPTQFEEVKGKLKIGLQWDAEVTISASKHTVSQAYCSALPIGYSQQPAKDWELFARLVLEATYEATFYAAMKNYERTENPKLYLTLVGGGVFRNPISWILDAIEKSILKFQHTPLEVAIVSYGSSNRNVYALLQKIKNKQNE